MALKQHKVIGAMIYAVENCRLRSYTGPIALQTFPSNQQKQLVIWISFTLSIKLELDYR